MKINPCGNRLYVRLLKVEAGQTKGGIFLPDMHSEETRMGEIVAIGPEVNPMPYKERIVEEVNGEIVEKIITVEPPPLFEVGDKVIMQFFSGTAIHLIHDGKIDDTHRVVGFREILAKVD